MPMSFLARGLPSVLALAVLGAPAADASDDHDHGPAPAAAGGPALPRFQAVSEAFELVGVIDGKNLRVWLDRFDDNAPIRGATIDLEIGGIPVALREQADGEFEATLASAPAEGMTPITATVTAGTVVDLLAADLDVHAATPAATPARDWTRIAAGASVALAVALLLARAGRRVAARRRREGAA